MATAQHSDVTPQRILVANLVRYLSWRLTARTPKGTERLTNVENVTWVDADAILTGTLTVRDPSFGVGQRVPLAEGDMVTCEFSDGGAFKKLWVMRVKETGLAVQAGQRTYQLANDLQLLEDSTDNFAFKVPKGGSKTTSQAIREVCAKYKVPVILPNIPHKRKKTWGYRNVSPRHVIEQELAVQRYFGGNRYFISWLPEGVLVIKPLSRAPDLIALGPTLIDAVMNSHLPKGGNEGQAEGWFASSVLVTRVVQAGETTKTEKDHKGHMVVKEHKISSSLELDSSVKRFGRVHRVLFSADGETNADMREEASQYLAAVAKPVRTLSLTHTGVPELGRGDAIRLGIGDSSLRSQLVWIKQATYSLSPGDYTQVMDVIFDDLYLDKKGERIQDKLGRTEAEAEQLAADRAARRAARTAHAAQQDDDHFDIVPKDPPTRSARPRDSVTSGA